MQTVIGRTRPYTYLDIAALYMHAESRTSFTYTLLLLTSTPLESNYQRQISIVHFDCLPVLRLEEADANVEDALIRMGTATPT